MLLPVGAQRFVNTEKFTFEVDDLRKRAAMMAHDDVMSLAYRRHASTDKLEYFA